VEQADFGNQPWITQTSRPHGRQFLDQPHSLAYRPPVAAIAANVIKYGSEFRDAFMRKWLLALLILSLAGCGESGAEQAAMPEASAQPAQRGGTITVGDSSWTIVPSTQCSVYPGNVVNIAGHAAEDESLEIVIDYGGPNQVRIGEGRGAIWHAVPDSIQMQIAGRRVTGSANFTTQPGGTGTSATGSWDVGC
jgi:hypothetical protein